MPTCQNCQEKWTWSQALRRSLQLGGGMPCPYCGEKQYYSARMRRRSGFVSFIIPLVLFGNLLFGPSIISVIVLLSLVPIYLLVIPFFMELANEEEPLF